MPRLTLLGVLRAVSVVCAALVVATVLPLLGVPARLLPDLVVVLVVSTAVLRGPAHGALSGLAAGWVVDLVPPGGSPLGLTALLYAGAGAVAGTFRRPGHLGLLAPTGALVAAAVTVALADLGIVVLGDGTPDLPLATSRVASTCVAGLLCLPLLLAVDRALSRRRLA